MREKLLDLVFLIGVFGKGIDGLAEVVGGVVLLLTTPAQLTGAARALTAEELTEDPHDLLATLLLHGTAHLDGRTTTFAALYLLVHGVVKLAIIAALLFGTTRLYPWAILALTGFLVFQIYQLVVSPGIGLVVLSVLDALIIWLTWREWRRGRTVRDAIAEVRAWRRPRRGTAD
ncbi:MULTISPECIES: DUF2127 domain-containing protein [unclassified Brevibacterium]|uniref:DUF2127 domain-containing protein n=1 Tax=unclassified Brevibacterium TaxID=2614124 RepID=UPI0010F5C242|nr:MULTISPECIES: DUF2127 domain-containing protein [unclassified Brevibacterium]MCM1012990.1 DUF2127 domain-containing protein [Brevibacterium sp. XM4083]